MEETESKKMGRPKKKEDKRMDTSVRFALSKSEKEELVYISEKEGRTLSEMVRFFVKKEILDIYIEEKCLKQLCVVSVGDVEN